jgi:hypothetical protein
MAFAYSAVMFVNSAAVFVNSIMAFVNGVTTDCVIINLSKINKGGSTEQDPGITNDSARLYAHISLILISNKAGLNISPLIKRKNILCRDSIINIDETILINTGFIIARRLISFMLAPILTEVITSVSSKNLFVDFIRKE